MPSLAQCLPSVPPLMRYGATIASGSSASSETVIASTTSPSNGSPRRRLMHVRGRRCPLPPPGHLAEDTRPRTRQESTVDVRHRLARDDVDLVAGFEHRRVGAVAESPPRASGRPARTPPPAPRRSRRRLRAGQLAHRGQQHLHGRLNRTGHCAQPSRATAAARRVTALSGLPHRPVARSAARGQPQPRHALLGGLDQVQPPVRRPSYRSRRPHPPLRCSPRSGPEVAPPASSAPCAAGLLIGGEHQRDRPCRDRARPLRAPAPPTAGWRRSPSCRPRRGPRGSRPRSHRRTGRPASPPRSPVRRRGARAAAGRLARRCRPIGRRGWPARLGLESSARCPPRPAGRRRTPPPYAPPARCRRRSWSCRSGSGRDRSRRPRHPGCTDEPVMPPSSSPPPDSGFAPRLCYSYRPRSRSTRFVLE